MVDRYQVPTTPGHTAPMPQPTRSPIGGEIARPLGPGTVPAGPEPQAPLPSTSPAPVERNQPAVPPARAP